MTNNRHPDGWTILKFTTNEGVFYKIFATWRWGNEEWILSSGAESVHNMTEEDSKYIWPQASGSIYHLPKDGERGFTFYQGQAMEGIIAKSIALGATVEIVKLQDVLHAL